MNTYKDLAARTGRSFIDVELSQKYFKKLPPLYGRVIQEAFQQKQPGNTIGVMRESTSRSNT